MLPLSDDNPTTRKPIITIGLIAINAAVFLYQVVLSQAAENMFVFQTGAIPYELVSFVSRSEFSIPGTNMTYPPALFPLPLTLFSAMFVHGGFMHAGGNMLYLWIFGNNIEDAMGHGRFLLFYLLAGLAASLVHVISEPTSTVPMIGASGAIAGVLGAYFVLYPHAKVKTLIFFFIIIQVIQIPAVIMLGLWFLIQLMNSGGGGGVAWYAHIGGFLFGLFLVRRFELPRLRILKVNREGEWR